jgi:hypothetical protein
MKLKDWRKLDRRLQKEARPLKLKRWPWLKTPSEDSMDERKARNKLRKQIHREFVTAGRCRPPRISWQSIACRRGAS